MYPFQLHHLYDLVARPINIYGFAHTYSYIVFSPIDFRLSAPANQQSTRAFPQRTRFQTLVKLFPPRNLAPRGRQVAGNPVHETRLCYLFSMSCNSLKGA